MVTFDTGGGLGNRLFHYVFARMLAENMGMKLLTPCPEDNVLTATKHADGKICTADKFIINETIDICNVLERDWGNRHIHLNGYWQEHHYYLKNRDRILSYFNERATKNTDQRNIVMHVRLTDYKLFGYKGSVINPKYYHDCLAKERFKRLFIVTDDPKDSYHNEFRRYRPIIVNGDEKSDFWFITEFDRIIVGNSTFSWWAAFLSNATKIYTPKCWIRNSADIRHSLQFIDNGKCKGIQVPAGFIDY